MRDLTHSVLATVRIFSDADHTVQLLPTQDVAVARDMLGAPDLTIHLAAERAWDMAG